MRENLVICPVYNEEDTLDRFYRNLRLSYAKDVLFVDDGSTDGGSAYLNRQKGSNTFLIRHPQRRGYGAALLTGFRFSIKRSYTRIVTIDADLQHDPAQLQDFFHALNTRAVVLGSRYALGIPHGNIPSDRLTINRFFSKLIHHLFSVYVSDPFCGFRGYRDSFLRKALLTEAGYGLGLEIVLEIIRTKTSFAEIPVKAIYNNHLRQFLDGLDDPRKRVLYYLDIMSARRIGPSPGRCPFKLYGILSLCRIIPLADLGEFSKRTTSNGEDGNKVINHKPSSR